MNDIQLRTLIGQTVGDAELIVIANGFTPMIFEVNEIRISLGYSANVVTLEHQDNIVVGAYTQATIDSQYRK
jgi:hypothetical protein